MLKTIRLALAVIAAAAGLPAWAGAANPLAAGLEPADVVLTDARIYTASGGKMAEALAVRRGLIVYVGDAAGAQPFIGKHTVVARANGGLVVPGLVDAHIHPLDIVDLDVCDLASKGKTLR